MSPSSSAVRPRERIGSLLRRRPSPGGHPPADPSTTITFERSRSSGRSADKPFAQTYLSPGPLVAHPEDSCFLLQPRKVRTHSPAVFYLHDWGETATAALSRSTRLTRFLQSLAELGYLVVVADFGDPAARDHTGSSLPFDSNHVAQRMEEYRRWLATRPAAASNANVSTIGLLGSGRGAASCLAYARAHRSTVSVMAAVNPVMDADLEALAPVAGIPWRGYYRSDDPAVDTATLAGLKRHLGESTSIYDVGTTGGHRTDVWGDLSFTAFTSWFSTYHPVPPH